MPPGDERVRLSVVIPCLNEAETVGSCVRMALDSCRSHGIAAEVIVADNGSTDGSIDLARAAGARIVHVAAKGYGNALLGGITVAAGEYVLMGDADASYDFGDAPRFVVKLDEGYDLVQGCRLPSGGGTVRPGAMPLLHRWWGNPMFSALARRWFGAPIHDVYCGLRAFRKSFVLGLKLQCTGMEFALEMIVKSVMQGGRIGEIPVVLWPDGRTIRRPHLRTFRDGWRSLRFFLLYSPRWLFLLPGAALIGLGMMACTLALGHIHLLGVRFDAHTMLFGSLAILLGFQAVLFALLTKTFAIGAGLLPRDRRVDHFYQAFTLERGLLLSAIATIAGGALLVAALLSWRAVGFGDLDYASTMRLVIPGVLFVALGIQGGLFSFFLSVLGLQRR